MAFIITFANQKGGTGKTTLCTNIAHALAKAVGADSVLVVDADPQASIIHWSGRRDTETLDLPFEITAHPKDNLHAVIPKQFGKRYKYILIDTPARITDIPRSAIYTADFVAVVTRPSTYDIDASKPTIDFIKESNIYRSTPANAAYVINDKDPRIKHSYESVITEIQETGLPVLPSIITTKDIFAVCSNKGLTIFEYLKEDSSHNQINQLTNEILSYDTESFRNQKLEK